MMIILLAALAATPHHDWAWAYKQLHHQDGKAALPDWCAVSTGGGYEKEENMLHGYCTVRVL